ncbi:hypothetical protein EV401DRAFT_1387514 [Pisolithus croceorrhizus]|nr:hypothetical protein EV401DRAFT_1387514 [Pisolithus croceorrhizus]
MSTTEEQLQLLYTTLYQLRALNNVTLSCVAFLVYDVLTNLDKEIHYIWRYYHNTDETHISWRRRLRRALVQVLFIFGRYYALLYLIGYFTVYNRQGLSIPLQGILLLYRSRWSNTLHDTRQCNPGDAPQRVVPDLPWHRRAAKISILSRCCGHH